MSHHFETKIRENIEMINSSNPNKFRKVLKMY